MQQSRSKLQVVIEIDGDSHTKREIYDRERTKSLNKYGIKVIRYNNHDVLSNAEGVYKNLTNILQV